MSVPGVSREAAMAHYGVVLAGELDDDSLSYKTASTDSVGGSRLGPAGVLFVWGPGSGRLCGGVSYADDVVRS